jgi:hypothetical protein
MPPKTGMNSVNSVFVLFGVQLKIRDTFENGSATEIMGSRRDIAATVEIAN